MSLSENEAIAEVLCLEPGDREPEDVLAAALGMSERWNFMTNHDYELRMAARQALISKLDSMDALTEKVAELNRIVEYLRNPNM